MDARIAAIFRRDQAVVPDGRYRDRGRRRSVPARRCRTYPPGHAPVAADGQAGPAHHDRRRRQHRPAGRQVPGKATTKSRSSKVARSAPNCCAGELDKALVLFGDATDEELLEQENIREMDLFLALTNDDEDNIMSGAAGQAAGLQAGGGADQPPRLCRNDRGRADRHRHFAGPGIDRYAAGARPAGRRRPRCTRCGAARPRRWKSSPMAMRKSSKVVGRRIDEIDWPHGVTVAALVRDFDKVVVCSCGDDGTAERRAGQVVIAHRDTVIEDGDHVIVFCTRRSWCARSKSCSRSASASSERGHR